MACEPLRFGPQSPFARFDHIRLQDGTSFAVKRSLAEHLPGRFTTVSPAAVELHADLDLMSETVKRVLLSPDSTAEREFLPAVEAVCDGLLLGDRGYYGQAYLQALDAAGAYFIVRAKAGLNALLVQAFDAQGGVAKRLLGRRLKAVTGRLARHACLALTVRLGCGPQIFEHRMLGHPICARTVACGVW